MSRSLPTVVALLLLAASCTKGADDAQAPLEAGAPWGSDSTPGVERAEAGDRDSSPQEAVEGPAVAASDEGADEIPAFLRDDVERDDIPDLAVAIDLADEDLEDLVAGLLEEREPTLEELMAKVSVSDDDKGPSPSSDRSLKALMASVTLEDGGSDDSWAYVDGAVPRFGVEAQRDGAATSAMAAAGAPGSAEGAWEEAGLGPMANEAPGAPTVVPGTDDTDLPTAGVENDDADPCQPLRQALAQHRDYLLRVGAERDSFGYVEDAADSNALRLLQGLRRCGSNPDDADCQRPPVELDISALEVPSHQIFRDPSDLEAEKKAPDDVPHDRVSVDLVHKLRACERSQIAQPLLQTGK